MWIVCLADDSHEMSRLVSLKNKKKIWKFLSAAVVIGTLNVISILLLLKKAKFLGYVQEKWNYLFLEKSQVLNKVQEIWNYLFTRNIQTGHMRKQYRPDLTAVKEQFNLYHSLGKFSRWQIHIFLFFFFFFFFFLPENRICQFMQIVSIGDNLHEMSKPVFWGKYGKYFKMSSTENSTQSAQHSSGSVLLAILPAYLDRPAIHQIFGYTQLGLICTFVCVEVLWPSQPNRVMSSAVSLPNHTFTGQA